MARREWTAFRIENRLYAGAVAAGIDTFTERWFSLRQLGVNRGLSVRKMRRLFAHEPGVSY